MAEYTGGYTSAVNDAQSRAGSQTQIQQALQWMSILAQRQQQEQEDRTRQQAARTAAGSMLPSLIGGPPEGPQAGPQAPPPGAASVPMQMPQQGGAPPGPPPMGALGGMSMMPPPGAQPQPQPGPQAGPPPGAPPTPPPGWQPSPAAGPELGGKPPMPPGGAPGALGAPPMLQPDKLPAEMLSVPNLIREMEKKKIPPDQMMDVLGQIEPIINSQNRLAIAEFRANTLADQAAERVRKDTYDAALKDFTAKSQDQRRKASEAASFENIRQKDRVLNARISGQIGSGAAGGAGASPITPQVVDFYAQQSIAGDNSWQVGLARGKAGQQLVAAVKDRIPTMAAELGLSPQEVGSNKAANVALTAALRDRTKFVAAGQQFVRNMTSQIDLVEKYMDKGTATGVPVFNKWIQAGRKGVAGDPDVTALDTAVRGLAREHQRIVTGVTSNAQLHVAAQETADKILNIDQSPAQMKASLKVMREEADNAIKAGQDEAAALKTQIAGMGKGKDAAAPAAAGPKKIENDAEYDALPSGTEFIAPDGKTRKKP